MVTMQFWIFKMYQENLWLTTPLPLPSGFALECEKCVGSRDEEAEGANLEWCLELKAHNLFLLTANLCVLYGVGRWLSNYFSQLIVQPRWFELDILSSSGR